MVFLGVAAVADVAQGDGDDHGAHVAGEGGTVGELADQVVEGLGEVATDEHGDQDHDEAVQDAVGVELARAHGQQGGVDVDLVGGFLLEQVVLDDEAVGDGATHE